MVRILLIDDNQDDRILAIRELSRAFADLRVDQIAEAEGFEEALSRDKFDIAITDYRLHWSDGIAILQVIKARYPELPVVMFTNSGNEEVAVEAMKAGLSDYVLKSPKHYFRLPGAVRVALEQAQQRQALLEAENRYSRLFDRVPVGLYRMTPQGQILEANPALVQLLGYSDRQALLAVKTIDFHLDAQERLEWQERMERDDLVRDLETQIRTLDGRRIWVRHNARAIRDGESKVLYYEGAIEDVTERKQVEEEIKVSLQEKEILLKEVHHRVKNNLQVINSLFRHQCRHTNDRRTTEILKQCQNRVNSIALLHEQLYQSKDLSKIEFARYIRSLVSNLFDSYIFNANTTLKLNVAEIFLDIETALPCGLIINELVFNSLKYAFPAGGEGEVQIEFHYENNHNFLLIVSDNGVGFPKDFDFQNIQSLGLKLVKSLVKQLGGTIEINGSDGTEFIITFTGVKDGIRD